MSTKRKKTPATSGKCSRRARHLFMTNGDTAAASAALRAALAANPHVPRCLPGSRTLPKHLPEIIALGETSEAIEHAVDATGRWQWVPGACDWLRRAWSDR